MKVVKSAYVGLHLEPDIVKQIDELAAADERTRADYIRRLVKRALRELVAVSTVEDVATTA